MSIPLLDNKMYTLCFADDQIVLAKEYKELEYNTQKFIKNVGNWV